MKKVTFIELTVYEKMLPLVSGYLQAYACKDPVIQENYTFRQVSAMAKTPVDSILQTLQEADSDVYAFSCYVWNMGLVQRLLAALQKSKPNAYFILGGPQVMDHAAKYLNPQQENVVLCNGEGEKTFYEFLCALRSSVPDFSTVGGLSFYQAGRLISTPEQKRIHDLDEIPSPFLTGLFQDAYNVAVFETNRGCPFHCGFCYWGAATNDRVFKFSEERIQAELDWLSQKRIRWFIIADANWGMLRRDVGLSQHIAQNARKLHAPQVVYYSAAKNQPDKVTQITEIFDAARVISTQPISMQTMNPTSLMQVARENIKLSTYVTIQDSLRQKGISTVTEMIWPLPGETLTSFQAGINTLCHAKAGTIIVYPHILLHNTPLYHKRAEFGFVTQTMDEAVGEVELITQTNEVNKQEYQAGLQFYFALHLLHNIGMLTTVADYLHQSHQLSHNNLFLAFTDFLAQQPDSPITNLYQKSITEDSFYEFGFYGKVAHFITHVHRTHFTQLLLAFVTTQPWWRNPEAQFLFEVDLLNQPYFYLNTPFGVESSLFRHIKLKASAIRSYRVELPEAYLALFQQFAPAQPTTAPGNRQINIDHKRLQYPFMAGRSLDHAADYCHGMLLRMQSILPKWEWEKQ